MHPGTTLTDAVRKWPTPLGSMKGPGGEGNREGGPTLQTRAQRWMTPTTAPEADNRGSNKVSGPASLGAQARGWPTPTASMATIQDMEQARFAGNDPRRPKYSEAMYPTPKAERYGSSQNGINRHGPHARPSAGTPSLESHGLLPSLPDLTTPTDGPPTFETSPAPSPRSLVLSPVFVEMLMGYPVGWSSPKPIDPRDYEAWETRFRPSRQR